MFKNPSEMGSISQHNLGNSISNLEAEIMKIVWDKGKVTVREVH